MPFQIVGQREVYAGFVNVRELEVELTLEGSSVGVKRFVSVSGRDSVGIVVVDSVAKQVLLIKQFRPVIQATKGEAEFFEIVAGYIKDGESPREAAVRELYEETGLTAGIVAPLGHFYTSPGVLSEKIHLFRAEADLSSLDESKERGDSEWERVTSRIVRLDEIRGMIEAGHIPDCKSALGLALSLSRS